jgi:hypothetical protein
VVQAWSLADLDAAILDQGSKVVFWGTCTNDGSYGNNTYTVRASTPGVTYQSRFATDRAVFETPLIADRAAWNTAYNTFLVADSADRVVVRNLDFVGPSRAGGGYQKSQTFNRRPLSDGTVKPEGPCELGWYTGINIRPGADDVEAYGNLVTNFTAGIVVQSSYDEATDVVTRAQRTRLRDNDLRYNNGLYFQSQNLDDTTNLLGAWGVLLKGEGGIVAANHFESNRSTCTYEGADEAAYGKSIIRHGNAIELSGAQKSLILRNVSKNDRHFSEVGSLKFGQGAPSDAQFRAVLNRFAGNLVFSVVDDATFLILRGDAADGSDGRYWGPTSSTKVFHNTVFYPGPADDDGVRDGSRTEGLVCGANCTKSVLKEFTGNIIWAGGSGVDENSEPTVGQTVYIRTDQGTPPLALQNVFYASNGDTQISIPQGRGNVIANPQLECPWSVLGSTPNLGRADYAACFAPRAGGPAIDATTRSHYGAGHGNDLVGPVNSGPPYDAGSVERQ